jgi:hypothetical protein
MEAIKTAAMAANAKAGQIGTVKIAQNGTTITVAGVKVSEADFADDFKTFYGAAKVQSVSVDNNGNATITLKAAIDKWSSSQYGKEGAKGAFWNGSKWEPAK